jgi:hypothetical protein
MGYIQSTDVIDLPRLHHWMPDAIWENVGNKLSQRKNVGNKYRPLSQVGTRRKRCPGQVGQDGMGSIPATPSTKHASCFPPSSMPASVEIFNKANCLSEPKGRVPTI